MAEQRLDARYYGKYVEGLLEKDAAAQVPAVEAHCKQRGLVHKPILRTGDLADCLVAIAREETVVSVVIGPPRSKKESGLRSRMELDTLGRGLPVPYVVASGE